jgi:hypothetical protein
MTFEEVRAIALALPGVEEGTHYGTPAFKVKGKAFTRLREDGETLVLFDVPVEEREVMIEAEPEVYFFTDHYRNWPAVLARLSAARPAHVRGYLERAWRKRAPKALLRSCARDAH